MTNPSLKHSFILGSDVLLSRGHPSRECELLTSTNAKPIARPASRGVVQRCRAHSSLPVFILSAAIFLYQHLLDGALSCPSDRLMIAKTACGRSLPSGPLDRFLGASFQLGFYFLTSTQYT